MCVIGDNDVAALLLTRRSPVRTWLDGSAGRPRLVVGPPLLKQLSANQQLRKYLLQLHQKGVLRTVEEAAFSHALCVSNDTPIIAIAISSGARTLCTKDIDLMKDFKKPALINEPRGRVYSREKHRPLLGHTTSCGVRT